jgi:hypothetical protein
MSKYGNPEFTMMNMWDKYKSSIRPNLTLDEKVLADALVAYSSSQGDDAAASRYFPRKSFRLFPLLKWTSIPIIAVALILLLNPFEGSGVAWGKVAERVDQSPTTIVREESFQLGEDHEPKPGIFGTLGYFSKEYGGYFEMKAFGLIAVQGFISPDRKLVTIIDPRTGKREQQSTDTPGPGLFNDPKLLVRDFLSHPYVKIGKKTINGIKAEGIEIPIEPAEKDSKKYPGGKEYKRLWVDIKTGLPIREEIKKNLALGELVNNLDFEWNKPLPQSLFQIPGMKKDPGKE